MKKRILSLVLCAAMLLSMCLFLGAGVAGDAPATEDFVPAVNFTNVAPLVQANAQAANGPARAPLRASANAAATQAADNGVVTSKTATANDDGTYTITLEAYATGSKVITEIQKDVPTDIVLVLDQSGSMDDPMGTVTYKKYSDRYSTNADNYDRRHNGGSANLWYPLSDDSYVPVNVEKTQAYTALPTNLKNYVWNSNNCYWNYRDALYEKVGDTYQKVTVTYTGNGVVGYTYTYTFSDGTKFVSVGNGSVPEFGSRGPLYTLAEDGNNTVYTYTYTDANGVTQNIGKSTGASEKYAKFYQRSVSSSGGGTRLAALKNAATEFANSVATKAKGKDGQPGTEDDIDHRIAVVGFACGQRYGDTNYNYKNTEVFVGKNQYTYGTAAQGQYKNAFQDMNNATGVQNVSDSIGALAADGGTLTDLGLEMANGIFQSNPITQGETRNRVVVVFTDGVPGWSGYDSDVAQSAIAQANVAKTTHSATVYSIGIFAGANATSPGNNSGNETQKANWFMQNLSSNDGVVKNPSYYLSAADADTLKNIFKQISDQIEEGGTTVKLDEKAVVKDVISPQFQLPKGTIAKDIQLETYACTGKTGDTYTWSKNDDAMGATATVEDGTVSVTGFDFAKNYVGTVTENGKVTYRGDKLVISFNVKPKDDFLGGNDVFTNDGAYIYDKSTATEPVCTFDDKPQVNVPIKDVTVTAKEQNVYLLGDLTADQLKADATVKVGDVTLDLTKANDPDHPYGLDKWQTDYVNITVTIQDADGNVISDTDLSDLTNDVNYTIKVEVAPKTVSPLSQEGTPAEAQTKTATDSVNVFKPELTYKDSEVYYGDTAPSDFKENLMTTKWKHEDVTADTAKMSDAPALTLIYTPDTDAIEDDKVNTRQDFGVGVTVKIDGNDVTGDTSFLHTKCDGKDCNLQNGQQFLFHVKTCSLTIKKTVTGGGDSDQTFVFNVKDKDDKVVTTIVLKDGKQKTITGLAVGDYTVVEDTGWSWSYTAVSGNNTKVTLSSARDSDTVEVTNKYNKPNWLTSIADVINKWVSATQIQQIPGKN